MLIFKILFIVQLILIINPEEIDENLFPVAIIHINDFHSNFEETNYNSGICKPEQNQKCIGGYARVVTMVKRLFNEQKKYNPIYLNAGDNLSGTLWYSYFKIDVVTKFLNFFPADAMTIGNHDLDAGVNGLAQIFANIRAPIVLSNMDDSEEPSIHGLYKKSVILKRYGRSIGVIGVLLQRVGFYGDIEKLKFNDEIESIKKEAEYLVNSGVNIIIVLSHCGIDTDRNIARNVGSNIDVIVGGHSHTFMYTEENPSGTDIPKAPYPEIISDSSGHQILIVQASAYTKYVGNLTIWFDQLGNIMKFSGAPILLDESIEPDPEIVEEMKFYKEIIDKKSNELIAFSEVNLIREDCIYGDCAYGNLLADAILHETENCLISFIAINNFRISLPKGIITYGDLKIAIPLNNTIDTMEIKGEYLYRLFEEKTDGKYLNDIQVSGVKILMDLTKPLGERLISVEIPCHDCGDVIKYSPMNKDKFYKICTFSNLANGYDHYELVRDNKLNYKPGPFDVDCIASFMKKISPITYEKDNRIIIIS